MSDTPALAMRLEKLIRANLASGRHAAPPVPARATSTRASAERTAGEPAAGAPHVLVAEADPLHRQVLARLVENLGYAVDCAATAGEAMAACARQPFALILLDCDSAVIRGLETAAVLRRPESGAEHTPILAVTARTGRDDQQEREAAGIDNYIARPILRENVESVLSRYAPGMPAEPPEAAPRYLALDRHRLEDLEQAAGSRAELLNGWITLFLRTAPELLEGMRWAQERGDSAALCDAANRLRSLSGQMGALRVQEICGIVSALAAAGSLAGVEPLLPELSISLQRAVRELNSFGEGSRRGHRLAAASAPGRARRKRRSADGNQALLAEADPLVARFLANSLMGAGFEVTHVGSGTAAVEALRERDFAVAILDLDVPEMDGYGVLSEIRLGPDADTPVMIVSSRHQEQDILRAFELGADDYVTVPFSPLEVVARVRRLVKQGAHVS